MSIHRVDASASHLKSSGVPLPSRLLGAIARGWAGSRPAPDGAEPPPGERTYEQVLATASYDVWVIRWSPGARIDLHDHAGSAAVVHVVAGELHERYQDRTRVIPWSHRRIRGGQTAVLPVGHLHEIHNDGSGLATSVHVYSPPLGEMSYYPGDATFTGICRLEGTLRE